MNPPGSSSSTAPPSRKRGQVYNAASVGLDFLGNIAEGSDILSPLKAACRATNSVLNVIQAIDDNQEEWDEITRRLDQYMSSMENQIDSFEKYPPEDRKVDEAFSRPLVHYVETLEDFCRLVENHRHKRSRSGFGTLTEIRKVKIDAGAIRKFNRDIEDLHRLLMEALGSFTAFRVQVIERNTGTTKAKLNTILTDLDASAILQLPMVAFVASSVHNTCLQGTRQAVLQTIWNWAEDDMSDKPIFWLCDIAGSGKSTVAMSVAESWRAQGILGGQFFFSMASSEASTTEKFCSTIARELANYILELAPHVAAVVKQNPAILRRPLHEQFRALVIEPLRHRQERIVLVLDAIDECKLGSQRRELLDTLSRVVGEARNLKIFITSRPDPVIEDILKPLSIKAELKDRLHDVGHHDNIDDISTYVHQSLREVLSHDKRQRLVEKAKGLFIWASTACRMLVDSATFDTPESIYNRLMAVDQNREMDEVYDLVFERTDPNSYSTMCSMLALLLAAFEPLKINDFDDLLKSAGICGRARALIRLQI
ncbi:related to archipelago beta form (F-box-WD40 repeat protein) [Serendipita indica DSM 11827]|uniref:Related to archipelago beta form (F-box-WD40 repeat protein) n=1 Tax=Serendipita indica (strain DSM 11827) TaxID=1109443 RepID=G4TZD4_SERID|nr:related to archipelago beta form (F-box-WD40 repeat protein) [Serendipita indica DSM 11827]